MAYFYNYKDEVMERTIQNKIDQFITKIKRDKVLCNYVASFGLTGTAARGQATLNGSDFDFYCITNHLNLIHEKK